MSGHANLIPLAKINRPWQRPRKIGYETTAWRDNGSWGIRLHYTNVASFDHDSQTLFISTGGWWSGITFQRINHGLDYMGLRLVKELGKWRVNDYSYNSWSIRDGNHLRLQFRDGAWYRVTK